MINFYPLIKKALFKLDPETAHKVGLFAIANGLVQGEKVDNPCLKNTVWGIDFDTPVGLAAGFDKDCMAVTRYGALGFGFAEMGSVTLHPQSGNEKPRIFRDTEAQAIINRMGFPSTGLEEFSDRIFTAHRKGISIPVGINIGKNKDSVTPAQDYLECIERLSAYADYFVINISSPNTAGLRDLQKGDALASLLNIVQKRSSSKNKPLLLKLSPDLTPDEETTIAKLALEFGINGLVISNTTTSRPQNLVPNLMISSETGGLSGAPLRDLSTRAIRAFYELTEGKLPIIGVGGISTGADAYEKIRAGASLVQIYSAFVFHGPAVVARIAMELADLLQKDGFSNISQAIGVDAVTGKTQLKAVI